MGKRISVSSTLAKQSPAKNLVVVEDKPVKEQITSSPLEQLIETPKEQTTNAPSDGYTEKSNGDTTNMDKYNKTNVASSEQYTEKTNVQNTNTPNIYSIEKLNEQFTIPPNNQNINSSIVLKNETPKEQKNKSSNKQSNKPPKNLKINAPIEQNTVQPKDEMFISSIDGLIEGGSDESTEQTVDRMMNIVRASFDIEFGLRLAIKISAPLYGVSMSELVHDALAIHLSKMEKIRGSEYHRIQAEVPKELPMRKRLEDLGY